eukprot:3506796-Lingulodinium_polyedra.AAC.1
MALLTPMPWVPSCSARKTPAPFSSAPRPAMRRRSPQRARASSTLISIMRPSLRSSSNWASSWGSTSTADL